MAKAAMVDRELAKVLAEDEAFRIASNFAKLPALLGKGTDFLIRSPTGCCYSRASLSQKDGLIADGHLPGSAVLRNRFNPRWRRVFRIWPSSTPGRGDLALR